MFNVNNVTQSLDDASDDVLLRPEQVTQIPKLFCIPEFQTYFQIFRYKHHFSGGSPSSLPLPGNLKLAPSVFEGFALMSTLCDFLSSDGKTDWYVRPLKETYPGKVDLPKGENTTRYKSL